MRKRNVHIQFWLDKKEAEAFQKKVKRSGLSREAYLRHLVNGLEPQDAPPPDYYAMMRELHGIGNNLNQIAKRVNETSRIYDADIDCLKENQEKIWSAANGILTRLASIRGMKNPGRVYLPGEYIVIDCNCHETYFVFLCGIVVIPLTDFSGGL